MPNELEPYLQYSSIDHKLIWRSDPLSAGLVGREDLVVAIKVLGTAAFGREYFTEYSLAVYITNDQVIDGFEISLPPIFSSDLREVVISPGILQEF